MRGCAPRRGANELADELAHPRWTALIQFNADWQQRMKDRKYSTLIPKGQKAPAKIR